MHVGAFFPDEISKCLMLISLVQPTIMFISPPYLKR